MLPVAVIRSLPGFCRRSPAATTYGVKSEEMRCNGKYALSACPTACPKLQTAHITNKTKKMARRRILLNKDHHLLMKSSNQSKARQQSRITQLDTDGDRNQPSAQYCCVSKHSIPPGLSPSQPATVYCMIFCFYSSSGSVVSGLYSVVLPQPDVLSSGVSRVRLKSFSLIVLHLVGRN